MGGLRWRSEGRFGGSGAWVGQECNGRGVELGAVGRVAVSWGLGGVTVCA